MSKEIANYMFQYATRHKIFADSGLITASEAYELANKWRDSLIDNWDEYNSPQMAIWSNCESSADYSTAELDIDYRDCEYEGGEFYRTVKKHINFPGTSK